jgi:hypothetical protein
MIDVQVFISLETSSAHKTQVEFRSHFSGGGGKCVLWAGKYDNDPYFASITVTERSNF